MNSELPTSHPEEPQQPQQQPQQQNITKIGILAVHGIGEQRQFQHLKEVAEDFIQALKKQDSTLEVHLKINKLASGSLGADQQTWDGSEQAPIIIKVITPLQEQFWFHLREVWWADIDPPNSIRKVFQFWGWGISLWATRGFLKNPILNDFENELIQLKPPSIQNDTNPQRIPWQARFMYGWIGALFLLIQPILSFLNACLQIFGIGEIPITILSQYMSKIRLYQRQAERGQGTLEDLDDPPRFTIRRRMINALIPMATSGYDRWYILAHSLGSIVAFNSLSEPELNLANYLEQSMWERAHNHGLTTQTPEREVRRKMKPSRPFWLGENDRIKRSQLFEKLHGFLTYGSPLGHFVDLWPSLMLANQKTAFNQQFKWYNIWDSSDPVATKIKPLFSLDFSGIPSNQMFDISYKADSWHLLSHTQYFKTDPKSDDALINRLLEWMMYDIPLENPNITTSKICDRWLDQNPILINRRSLFSYFLWFVGGYLGALLLHWVLHIPLLFKNIYKYPPENSIKLWFIPLTFPLDQIKQVCQDNNICNILIAYPLQLIVWSILIVFLAGVLRMLFVRDKLAERIYDFLEYQANQTFTLEGLSRRFFDDSSSGNYEPTKKTIEPLVKKKRIRKLEIQEQDTQYFYPKYSFFYENGFRTQLPTDRIQQQQLIREIYSYLDFEPDVPGENREQWQNRDGYWLLKFSNKILLYRVIKSTNPLQYSIINLIFLFTR